MKEKALKITLLFTLLFAIATAVTLQPYGSPDGELNCDNCSSGNLIPSGYSIVYFGGIYYEMYVSSNGMISLGSEASTTTTFADVPVIAPFMFDITTENDGTVFYRTDLGADTDFDTFANDHFGVNFQTTYKVVATYDQVGPKSETTSERNTFQAVVYVSYYGETAVCFNYPENGLNWPDLSFSTFPTIGFFSGSGLNLQYYLPGSGSVDSANLDSETGNFGEVGQYCYLVNSFEVRDQCVITNLECREPHYVYVNTPFETYDVLSSSETCTDQEITISRTELTCDELNQLVPVTASVGNEECTTYLIPVANIALGWDGCPDDITAYAVDSTTVDWDAPTAFGDCLDASQEYHSHESGAAFYLGTTTVTYIAYNYQSKSVTCTFDVTVLPIVEITYEVIDNLNRPIAGASIAADYSCSPTGSSGKCAVLADGLHVGDTIAAGTFYVTFNGNQYSIDHGDIQVDCHDVKIVIIISAPGFFRDANGAINACQPGTYSNTYEAYECCNCAVGTFAANQYATECEECPPAYSSEEGAYECFTCSAGYYLYDDKCVACPEGKYSCDRALVCHDCPAGSWAMEGSAACTFCDAGYYLGMPDDHDGEFDEDCENECIICPANTYSAARATKCIPCPDGSFSDEGACECTFCEAGYYLGMVDDHDGHADEDCEYTCLRCPANTYSNDRAKECTPCPEGSYAQPGSKTCTFCEAGYYLDNHFGGCKMCPGGTFSNERATECTPCPPGGFAHPGSSECEYCEAGYYMDMPPDEPCDCLICPAGTYSCPSSTQCEYCPDGTWSTPGSATCFACKEGHYMTAAGVCEICPANTYSPDNAFECTVCPEGSWSEEGASECYYCIGGYFLNSEYSQCELCPDNTFSSDRATECTPCPPGGYSFEGSVDCMYCEAGFYADPSSGTCLACAPGYYSCERAESCKQCPEGSWSSEGSAECTYCSAGQFLDPETQTCLWCPAGTFSAERATTCTPCPDGFFSFEGSTTCFSCTAGSFLNIELGYCEACPDGTTSGDRATECFPIPTAPANEELFCTGGSYLDPEIGDCAPCPQDTYSHENANHCTPCPDGSYSFEGSDYCIFCEAGYFLDSVNRYCAPCAPGTFALARATECLPCAFGYVSGQAADECTACPEGTVYEANECKACDENSFVIGNVCVACADWEIPDVCECCPPGYELDMLCTDCAAGFYSADGRECLACGEGTYSGVGWDHCVACEDGSHWDYASEACVADL